MMASFCSRRCPCFSRSLTLVTAFTFILSFLAPPSAVFAQGNSSTLNLPAPGTMVSFSQNFTPLYIKGITINPEDPLKFSFIMNAGDTGLEGEELKVESQKLMKYFLAALTVPEEDLWVNLSPYDRANIIPERFGYTEMGKDLLAQDYMLKQIAASVMYPDAKTGSTFWKQVQQRIKEKFGITDVPVNMFNKIWIVPDKAEVYEINGTAYVVDSHLKVMLEEDYFALKNDSTDFKTDPNDVQAVNMVSAQVVRDVLLPEIEKEVNEGKNFANLRQIYNANILATWYKMTLKDSLLGQVYVDKNKVSGVDTEDKNAKLKIYEQYVSAFKKGAYELIKKDYDPATQQVITKKYFAGGVALQKLDTIMSSPVKVASQGEYNNLSDNFRKDFETNVAKFNGTKDYVMEVAISPLAKEESKIPQADNFENSSSFSPDLASLPRALEVAGARGVSPVVQQKISRTVENSFPDRSAPEIRQMVTDVEDFLNSKPKLNSADDISKGLIIRGWEAKTAGQFAQKAEELAKEVIGGNPVVGTTRLNIGQGQTREIKIMASNGASVGNIDQLRQGVETAIPAQWRGGVNEVVVLPTSTLPLPMIKIGQQVLVNENYQSMGSSGVREVPEMSMADVVEMAASPIETGREYRKDFTINVRNNQRVSVNVALEQLGVRQTQAVISAAEPLMPEQSIKNGIRVDVVPVLPGGREAVLTDDRRTLVMTERAVQSPQTITAAGRIDEISRNDLAKMARAEFVSSGEQPAVGTARLNAGQGQTKEVTIRASEGVTVSNTEQLRQRIERAVPAPGLETLTDVIILPASTLPAQMSMVKVNNRILVNRNYDSMGLSGAGEVREMSMDEVAAIAASPIETGRGEYRKDFTINVRNNQRVSVNVALEQLGVRQTQAVISAAEPLMPEQSIKNGIRVDVVPVLPGGREAVLTDDRRTLVMTERAVQSPQTITAAGRIDEISRNDLAKMARAEVNFSGPLVDTRVMSFQAFSENADNKEIQRNLETFFRFTFPELSREAAETLALEMRREIGALRPNEGLNDLTNKLQTNLRLNRIGINNQAANPGLVQRAMDFITRGPSTSAGRQTLWASFNVYPEQTRSAVRGAMEQMSSLGLDNARIPVAVSALEKAAANPVAYLEQDALERSFETSGLTKGESRILIVEFENIANEAGQRLPDNIRPNVQTASLAPILYSSPADSSIKVLGREYEQQGMEPATAQKAARTLVENKSALIRPENMQRTLSENNIPAEAIAIATGEGGIRALMNTANILYRQQEGLNQTPGGIDINPAFLKMLVKRDGKGIPIPMAKIPVKDTDIYGFEPVISKVEKVENLPAFIGIEDDAANTARNIQ